MMVGESITVYSTCPPYNGSDPAAHLDEVRRVSGWSEAAGCRGMLVYTDNGLLDPWLVSQIAIQSTRSLSPLVAVQPVYMHPYSVAKMVSSLGYLYGRRIHLNMVAGGFKGDLLALDDTTPHDQRYDRLIEYTTIIQMLLAGSGPVTFHGNFYRVERLTLKPSLPAELYPAITISGSSDAGLKAARALSAIPVIYPEPPEKCHVLPEFRQTGGGIRVGIIARGDEEEAWTVAENLFPSDRTGQVAHHMAMKASDSVWHRSLSEIGRSTTEDTRSTYWLWPFQNYKTFCPYLVGTYDQVAGQIARYAAADVSTFILDVPRSEEDFSHISKVFQSALRRENA